MKRRQWYVSTFMSRHWFGQDEDAARTFLLLMCCAFEMKAGIDVFLGYAVPAHSILQLTGNKQ